MARLSVTCAALAGALLLGPALAATDGVKAVDHLTPDMVDDIWSMYSAAARVRHAGRHSFVRCWPCLCPCNHVRARLCVCVCVCGCVGVCVCVRLTTASLALALALSLRAAGRRYPQRANTSGPDFAYSSHDIDVASASIANKFWGIGGLSGGGSTTRLLVGQSRRPPRRAPPPLLCELGLACA